MKCMCVCGNRCNITFVPIIKKSEILHKSNKFNFAVLTFITVQD